MVNQNRFVILCCAITLCFFWGISQIYAEESTTIQYVGSEICGECHEDQYDNYSKFANKAHSYKSVMIMKKGLTEAEIKDCYRCHTTGYGQPGGFVSEAETPELKNTGCEVCHGPGGAHVESEDPEDIISEVSIDQCNLCHTTDRVDSFRYKPVLHAGAH